MDYRYQLCWWGSGSSGNQQFNGCSSERDRFQRCYSGHRPGGCREKLPNKFVVKALNFENFLKNIPFLKIPCFRKPGRWRKLDYTTRAQFSPRHHGLCMLLKFSETINHSKYLINDRSCHRGRRKKFPMAEKRKYERAGNDDTHIVWVLFN